MSEEQLKSNWIYKLDKLRMRLRLLGTQDWSSIDKVFIVSTGRTGTQFFAKFLNQFSSVYALHEPHPAFLRLAIDYACGEVTKLEAAKKIERCRRALCKEIKRKEANIYVESNNRFFSLLPALQEAFTDFKIIHIVRDGRDYVRSGMSRNWYTKEDDSSRLRAIYFEDDKYKDKWGEMTRFEKICWRWQKKDNFIWQNVKDNNDAITVKFEDIFKDDEFKGIYRIAEYIGLPKAEIKKIVSKMMEQKVHSTEDYAIPHWTDWDQEMMDKFNRIAGEHMRNYYDY